MPNANAPELPLYLDSTMMAAFRSCQTKFRWEFLLTLRPGEASVHLHAGAAFATGLETLYRALYVDGKSKQDALDATEFAFLKAWGDYTVTVPTPKSKDRMLDALIGAGDSDNLSYFQVYNPPHDHIVPWFENPDVQPFEFSFALPLDRETTGLDFPRHPSGSPFLYAGRLDLLGKYEGVIVGRDDKTASSIGATWANQWSLRGQFLGYVFALQHLGIPCSTIAVRGVAIQKTQFKHAEAIKSYPRFLVDRWLLQLQRDVENLLRAYESDFFESNLGESCTSYGGCQYLDLCRSTSPESWFSSFKRSSWNPLLRNPVEETTT